MTYEEFMKAYQQAVDIMSKPYLTYYLRDILPVEQDERGWFIGYKVLKRLPSGQLSSPRFPAIWDGIVESHIPPSSKTLFGIHACKTPKALQEWWIEFSIYDADLLANYVAAKVALWGKIVIQTERGYRAQYATLLEVLHEYR